VRVFAPKVSLGFPEALGDESFDYRRCVLPSANGDRGRMSYVKPTAQHLYLSEMGAGFHGASDDRGRGSGGMVKYWKHGLPR
jgi:hypothetical protein